MKTCLAAPSRADPPKVSVILVVYNEAKYLPFCLETLASQTHPNYEVIIVDDGSTDATLEICTSWAQQHGFADVIRQGHQGWTHGRNLGASHAAGQILVFLDGDMVFHRDFLAKLVLPITSKGETGTFSKEEYVANYDNIWARCWNLNDGLTTDRRHPDDFPDEHSSFRAVRKDRFLDVGGYDHHGAGSDYSLAERIGELAVAAPGAMCYHYNPSSLAEVFRQARWYGRGHRIKATWQNLLRHSLPVSVAGSLRRAWRHHVPQFVLFKVVFDAGVLAGLNESLLFPQRTQR